MKVLYIIPARGGSKGIPGKNIKNLAGKPLIQYTLEAAQEVTINDHICVSTDSIEIKEVVENLGLKVPFLRPPELSTDTANSEVVIKHALEYFEENSVIYDYVVLLQPTSPFRTGKHIEEALKLINNNVDMVVSVSETKSNPYYVLFEENTSGNLIKSKEGSFTRRQDCPTVYELNGAIYVINVNALKTKKSLKHFDKLVKYGMDHVSSIDIDEPLDWEFAEFIMKKRNE
ncbi:MAG: CMP-N,N'-diacetyllegionaminic acid synthase [Parvicella sp.]|jgi:CMP-N,N'-diacetyllegionaminic acid synthase